MEMTHLISNNNHALNMLLNIYGTDWWMDFTYEQEIVDVNFHRINLAYCKMARCGAVEKNLENYKSHFKYCIFNQEVGEYEAFWELLKMNLIHNQQVNLITYRVRSNTLRIEEESGKVTFTNNQHDVEIYLNRVIKGKETILGDLRIMKNDDLLPKENISRNIVTLNDAEIAISAGKSYKEKIRTRIMQEEHMRVKEKEPKTGTTQKSFKKKSTRDERVERDSEEITELEIVQNDRDRGFKFGNKSKGMRTRYQERKDGEGYDRMELKGNAATNFIAHNLNIGGRGGGLPNPVYGISRV
jgi:hypothetical protein